MTEPKSSLTFSWLAAAPTVIAGKVNTAALSAILWERHRLSLILFTGVAGGIDPSLSVGDLVVGERTIQHDAGVLSPDGLQRYQAGQIPFFNPTLRLGIDHLVIRSLSDLAAGGAAEHFDRFLAEVSVNSARMVLALLERLQEDDRDLPVGP